MHIQRPITGDFNLKALRVLYDLFVEQTGSLGAHIGRAVSLADAAALNALPPDWVGGGHQPWWTA